MKSPTRHTLLSLAVLPALLATGCTAQEVSPKTSRAVNPPSVVAQNDLFVKNDNLQAIYFESGKSQLAPDALNALKTNVAWLKQNLPLQIEVAGYSDGRGTPEQNLAMGQRRAAALRDYYVAMGIPRSRISTVTLGQEEPVCFEPSEDCWSKNRRVETFVENKSLASR